MNLEVEPHASHTVYFHCSAFGLKGNRITHQLRCDWNTPPHHTEPLGPTHARMLTGFVLILVRRLLFHSGIWPPAEWKGSTQRLMGFVRINWAHCPSCETWCFLQHQCKIYLRPPFCFSAQACVLLLCIKLSVLLHSVDPPPPLYMFAQHE